MNRLKYEKQKWILENISKYDNHVDILNDKFVAAYIEQFNPKIKIQPYGANTCRELGRLLSEMYRCNLLERFTIGLSKSEVGAPKWCYCYTIKNNINKKDG